MEPGAVRHTRGPGLLSRRAEASPIRLVGLPRGRSVVLLVSLALLALGPWLNESFVGLAIWELLFTLVMLSGIARLSVRPGQAVCAALLALPGWLACACARLSPPSA
jgi:hypothetical protein